ncbi:MAG TPA: glycosyltransferase family 4 protein [Pyrinomonadaceae bacterium]|nr:glycosyltransferase family 4 protein [Pyrinomonadaceae bacterium]
MRQQLKVVHISSLDLGISFLMPQLRALKADGFEVHAMCADGPLVPTFEAEGIKVHRLNVTREISPAADLKLLWRLVEIMRRESYTIVHTHTPKMELLGQFAAWLARAPVRLYTNHGLIFLGQTGFKRSLFKTIARVAGLYSDRVISQSAEDVSTLIEQKIYRRRKVGFLGNGIDLTQLRAERFTPGEVCARKKELGIPENHKVVGMVGRYVWEKGYREFFEAAQKICRARAGVSFVTVGIPLESERDPVDFSILRELGIEERVFVLKSRDDMPELYALMDVVALPSYREGFPRSLMEASAMSKPTVASDVSGCRQAIVNGRNGYLVPVRDSRALAEKIELLLDDAELAHRLGCEGRSLAEERFDVSQVIERLRGCYDELLKQKLPAYERETYPDLTSQPREVKSCEGR